VFLSYLCTVLLPFLGEHRPDAVIVLDNLKSHHNETAQKAITDAGLTFIYLPPYSPEWAPIEECWSKIKEYLRSVAARTTQALQGCSVLPHERAGSRKARPDGG
jgi:transposase